MEGGLKPRIMKISGILSKSREFLISVKEKFEKNDREELQEATDAAEEALSRVGKDLPKEKEVDLEIAWTEDPNIAEHMGGAVPHCESDSKIKITVNPNVEKWQISVLNAAVHGYAHAFYYENAEFENYRTWNLILEEAFALLVEEWMITEYEHAWWRQKFSKDDINKYWLEIKEDLDKKRTTKNDPQYLTENGVNALYPLCYMIGEELFKEHHIEDFHKIEKTDVLEAGNKLFN